MTPVVIDCPMFAVEVVAARIIVGHFTAVIVAIYHPGSDAAQSAFHDELVKVFETVTTYLLPGGFNVHFECCDNPNTHQLFDLFESFVLNCQSDDVIKMSKSQ